MEGFNFLLEPQWQPFKKIGLEHSFFNVDVHPVTNSWLVIACIALLGLYCYYTIRYNYNSLVFYLIMNFIKAFYDTTVQTLGFFSLQHFSFVTALFVYILLCNSVSLFPGTEEPTKNINTTLALGLISFIYVQYYTIKAQGFWNYIKEYFHPIFIMFPLNVISRLASIISMSFRLFGNIFGGATIASIYFTLIRGSALYQIIGLLSGINLTILLFFGLFEGVIQAFVFAMLTITYISIGISSEQDDTAGIV